MGEKKPTIYVRLPIDPAAIPELAELSRRLVKHLGDHLPPTPDRGESADGLAPADLVLALDPEGEAPRRPRVPGLLAGKIKAGRSLLEDDDLPDNELGAWSDE